MQDKKPTTPPHEPPPHQGMRLIKPGQGKGPNSRPGQPTGPKPPKPEPEEGPITFSIDDAVNAFGAHVHPKPGKRYLITTPDIAYSVIETGGKTVEMLSVDLSGFKDALTYARRTLEERAGDDPKKPFIKQRQVYVFRSDQSYRIDISGESFRFYRVYGNKPSQDQLGRLLMIYLENIRPTFIRPYNPKTQQTPRPQQPSQNPS